MEQLIKEETQKHLANQMREARLQRQIQVRQQALAWTDATRKKFEEAKERQVKILASSVTAEVQNAAMKNIEELTRQHDLAMAEIGMAHRAAAGFQNVERLKSLKRLKNDEVAKNRGSTAMMRHLSQREVEKSKSMAVVKRKKEVRELEDKLSKDLISRRPLSVTNSNVESKVSLRPPEYQQSIAKTLKVATSGESKKPSSSQTSSQVKGKASKTSLEGKGSLPTISSSDLLLKDKDKPVKKGLLQEMVRIKESSLSNAGIDFVKKSEDDSTVEELYGVGYKLRDKYMNATRGAPTQVPAPIQSKVRYFDASLPKSEVKYIAPKGLAVKESRHSPDAWEKGKQTSEKSLQHQRIQELKQEEVAQKAVDRGKLAMKKAKLEKEILEVRNELMEEIDQELIGTGSQKALLGLDKNEVGIDINPQQNFSSDEFSAVESDEEFSFPSPSKTLKKYDVIHDKSKDNTDGTALVLKPISSSDSPTSKKVQGSSSTDSFESYSPPSLHSIGSENSEDEKVLKQQSTKPIVGKESKRTKAKRKDEDKEFTRKPSREKVGSHQKKKVGESSTTTPTPTTMDSMGKQSEDSYYEYEPDNNLDLVKPKSSSIQDMESVKRSKAKVHPSRKRTSKSSASKIDLESVKKDSDTDSVSSFGIYNSPSSPSEDKVLEKSKNKDSSGRSKDDIIEPKSKKKDYKEKTDSVPAKKPGGPTHEKKVDSKRLQGKIESDSTPSTNESSDKSIDSSKRKSSSGSTIAEINIKTTSAADATKSDPSISSLKELHSRAREQEKLLRKSPTNSSTSLSDLQEDSLRPDKKTAHSSLGSTTKPVSHPSKSKKERKEFRKPKSQSLSSSSRTESDESSALLNLKIKQFDDSAPSQSNESNISGSKHSTSGESSALVNLKIIEQTESTPSRSEKSESNPTSSERTGTSGSVTTDYYSLPEGPFTSTPDGKLHPSKLSNHSLGDDDTHVDLDNLKRRTLYHYMDKFLKRKPDSIENLPVTTSSSSVIKADSDVITSESFADVTDENNLSNETQSSYQSHYKSNNSSQRKNLSSLYEGRFHSESGSTIAQAAIVAGRIVSTNTTSKSDSSAKESDSTKRSTESSKDVEPVSSDSLTGLLRVLSNHQDIEKHQLDIDEIEYQQDLHRPFTSGLTRSNIPNQSSNNPNQSGNADSSRDSIPDASAILRRITSRPSRPSTSRTSSSSSPKSGPERETKRVELLDDVTPVRLWETPPRASHSGANETEKLSAVFEKLIDKWSNLRIEKPPWTPFSDQSEKDGK